MVAFHIGDLIATGTSRCKDALGGDVLEQLRASVLEVVPSSLDMARVPRCHSDEPTIGLERQ
jgi:hypothetical protein